MKVTDVRKIEILVFNNVTFTVVHCLRSFTQPEDGLISRNMCLKVYFNKEVLH